MWYEKATARKGIVLERRQEPFTFQISGEKQDIVLDIFFELDMEYNSWREHIFMTEPREWGGHFIPSIEKAKEFVETFLETMRDIYRGIR